MPRRYSITRLKVLLESYLNLDSEFAKINLSNTILDGGDLVDILEEMKHSGKYINPSKLKEKQDNSEILENLTEDINQILGTKEGELVDKIKEVMNKYTSQ